MLEIFHVIMIYLGIIGKTFSEAGLRDVIVQSDVIAIRSVHKTLSGKMYIRTVRLHKVVYEAL